MNIVENGSNFSKKRKVNLSISDFVHAQSLSHVCFFPTLWTIACQAPLSMEFFRQENWSGLPFLPAGDLRNPGIEPTSLASPALAGKFSTTASPGKPTGQLYFNEKNYFRTFLVVQWLSATAGDMGSTYVLGRFHTAWGN